MTMITDTLYKLGTAPFPITNALKGEELPTHYKGKPLEHVQHQRLVRWLAEIKNTLDLALADVPVSADPCSWRVEMCYRQKRHVCVRCNYTTADLSEIRDCPGHA